MTQQSLEKYQVVCYVFAIAAGLLSGINFPKVSSGFETLLWPVLGLLLYVTFTQVSLSNLSSAFTDLRFIGTALAGNFLVLPLIVWVLINLLPGEPALKLGVALVLLVPCTDWFITFSQLGGADVQRALAFSPISLLAQLILLPFYLFLFFGSGMALSLATGEMIAVFTGIIIIPLLLAYVTERWSAGHSESFQIREILGWFPVPLLAFVIFLISASHSHVLLEAPAELWYAAVVFVAFLIIAALTAKTLSKLMALPVGHARVLAFSFGSRNSFVVLPIALALPEYLELAVPVVVLQSLIELSGMAIYVWVVPKLLFRMR